MSNRKLVMNIFYLFFSAKSISEEAMSNIQVHINAGKRNVKDGFIE